MKTSTVRRAIVPGLAVLALAMSACGAANETSGSADAGAASSANLSGTLKGGGATSQEKAQGAWVAMMQDNNQDLTVNYEPVGSGDGIANFVSGGYSFAGTDSALTDDEGELSDAKKRCGGDPIQVPGYISPIAVVVNLKGVDKLNLDAATLSDIFSGKITKWNDPKIAKLNQGVKLPGTTISPVHRSDDSGTQENFTGYLAEAGNWSEKPDGVWPSKIKGEGGDGTSGVVSAVQSGEGTIGFVDDSAAVDAHLTRASIKVGQDYVQPSADGASKVFDISKPAGLTDNDMAVALARDTTEKGAYPIVLVSYLLACPTYDDKAEANLVKGYLSYVLSQDGQKVAAEEAGSAPLSAETSKKATALVNKIAAK